MRGFGGSLLRTGHGSPDQVMPKREGRESRGAVSALSRSLLDSSVYKTWNEEQRDFINAPTDRAKRQLQLNRKRLFCCLLHTDLPTCLTHLACVSLTPC